VAFTASFFWINYSFGHDMNQKSTANRSGNATALLRTHANGQAENIAPPRPIGWAVAAWKQKSQ